MARVTQTAGFFVTFTCTVTLILKLEAQNHFWLITQSILDQSALFLARKIQKIHGNNPIMTESLKTRRLPVPFTRRELMQLKLYFVKGKRECLDGLSRWLG